MIKPILNKMRQLPLGIGIIIVIILIILMFIVGIIIGYLLNHQNPIEFFNFHTWKHLQQLFGG